MIDDQYSRAVVAYVGKIGHLNARPPEDRIVEAIGDRSPDVVPRIRAMLDDLYSAQPTM